MFALPTLSEQTLCIASGQALRVLLYLMQHQAQMKTIQPQYLADRLLLDKINYEKKTVTIGGTEYAMKDVDFPTVDPKDPYRLTPEEEQVVERLRHAFVHCEKLQRHIRFLFFQGKPLQGL